MVAAGPPDRPSIAVGWYPRAGARNAVTTLAPMGNWYWIGVFAGLGVALGIAAAAGLAGRRVSILAPFLAAAVAIALGIVFFGAEEAAGGGVGGILVDVTGPGEHSGTLNLMETDGYHYFAALVMASDGKNSFAAKFLAIAQPQRSDLSSK